MLQTLKELLGAGQPPAAAAPAQVVAFTLQRAVAVMPVEVMRADTHFDAAGRLAVCDVLRAEEAGGG
jgi:hypothetical protein